MATEFQSERTLDYDTWRDLLSSLGVLYSSERFEGESFAGSLRAERVYGFDVVDLSCNAYRVDRTHRHARLDGMDHFKASFQLSGKTTLIQNDRVTELAVGDCGLFDIAQPFSIVGENVPVRVLCVYLPRRLLTSHLGLQPNGGLCWRGDTPAARLLFRLVLDAVDNSSLSSVSTETCMQLAVLDLLGALMGTVRSAVQLLLYGQAVHASLQRRQSQFLQSRHSPTGRSRRGGDLATISPEALHSTRHDMQPFYQNVSFRPRGSSSASPGIDEDTSAAQRDRLRLWLS
jgi:hypothetical protein